MAKDNNLYVPWNKYPNKTVNPFGAINENINSDYQTNMNNVL